MTHLLAAGSVLGRDHLLGNRPCQDAFRLLKDGAKAVAVVCDGCGSEPHSGAGALLGASMTARAIMRRMARGGGLARGEGLDLSDLRAELLAGLASISWTAGIGVRECLLFTIVAAAVSDGRATVFSCGDGMVMVDGKVRVLGPFPGNAPPYLAYGLEGGGAEFELIHDGPAGLVAIGTDGAADMDLASLCGDPRCWTNPDIVRRRLALSRPADDATVALIKEERHG
ncbi:MAG: protein phosphatase 2C domain-containing protein [Elusimicrobia bacterium]|nr:protein phosphatase 2C domain-containing protein [Elusimicrobiota bacterium]